MLRHFTAFFAAFKMVTALKNQKFALIVLVCCLCAAISQCMSADISLKNEAPLKTTFDEPSAIPLKVLINSPEDESEFRAYLADSAQFSLIRSETVTDSYKVTTKGLHLQSKSAWSIATYWIPAILTSCLVPSYRPTRLTLKANVLRKRDGAALNFQESLSMAELCWVPAIPLALSPGFHHKKNIQAAKRELVNRFARSLKGFAQAGGAAK